MAATTACCNPRMSLFCLQKWATSCRNTADYQNLIISNLNCCMVFKQDFSSTQRSKTRILNRQKWSPNTKGILWLNKYNNNALQILLFFSFLFLFFLNLFTSHTLKMKHNSNHKCINYKNRNKAESTALSFVTLFLFNSSIRPVCYSHAAINEFQIQEK